jgi:asparagine synthase (glutamine-hydrolysing)
VSAFSITGVARLDNRAELLTALGPRPAIQPPPSDLALVLRAYERWAECCPERLLGDFAFLIREHGTGAAFGARDPLGVAPFYYRAASGRLAFATRAAGIAEIDGLPLELDERRIADVLVPELECIDATSTFYRGVLRLPPGHRLIVEGSRLTVARYWSPDPPRAIHLGSDAEYDEAFREVFTEAVRCRLTGSTASMLSGGLDSSAIVAFAREIRCREGRAPLTTLSAVTGDRGCEETRYIREVLGLPDLDPITLLPGQVGVYRREIEAFVESMEEPFDGAMLIPMLLYNCARNRGFEQVLDGVDGDSVASTEPDVLAQLLRGGHWGRALREARGFAAFYTGTYGPWSSAPRLLAANAVRAFAPSGVRAALRPMRQARAVRLAALESMLSREFASRIDLPERLRTLWESDACAVTHPRVGSALERYDRVAASQGIAPRHPFLDRRVVEFCLALPWDQRVRDGWSKRIVRLATAGLLPDPVRWRRGRWVRLGGRFLNAVILASGEFLSREISDSPRTLTPYVDLTKLRASYDRFLRGDAGSGETVWKLAVLSSWLRRAAATRYDARARANGPAALPCLPIAG